MKTKRIDPKEARITLLTQEQAYKLPHEMLKRDCYWWLSSPSCPYKVAGVDRDGWVHDDYYVDDYSGGVVPAFAIDSLKAMLGEEVYVGKLLCTVVDKSLVLSNEVVCKYRYDAESSDWETSDLRALVESDEFAEEYILDGLTVSHEDTIKDSDASTATLTVNLENLNDDERSALLRLIEKANKSRKLSEVPVGETFKVAGTEFIHFGGGTAVTRDVLFDDRFYDRKIDDVTDFAESDVFYKLKAEFLPKIITAVGTENVLPSLIDSLALDGTDKYGRDKCLDIAIPTLDFYRKNRCIFNKYPVTSEKWWLATAASTDGNNAVCIAWQNGQVNCYPCYGIGGVRPLLTFNPDMSVM